MVDGNESSKCLATTLMFFSQVLALNTTGVRNHVSKDKVKVSPLPLNYVNEV